MEETNAEVLHDDIDAVGGDFTRELKREVIQRDGRVCQICGAELEAVGLDVHHVVARGMGGSPSKNVPSNLITLCRTCHNDVEASRKIIKKWEPADKDNGFKIRSNESGQFQDIPKEDLYFYHIPRQALVDEAHQKHTQAINYVKEAFKQANQSIEIFIEIKQRKLYKHISKNENEFYSSFREYYRREVMDKFAHKPKGPLSLHSINSYVSSLSSLQSYLPNPEQRAEIPRGLLADVASIVNDNNIPEEEKEFAIESARRLDKEKDNVPKQEEFKKLKRDLKVEYGSAVRAKICDECMVPEKVISVEFEQDGEVYGVGDRGLRRCPVSGKFLESQKGLTKERRANRCEHYKGQD